MTEPRYPIGIQTFAEIIGKGYTYVDKTRFLYPLTQQGKYIFLSRPRRFGKSLLLSTLEAYFSGKRELFKGLAADSMDLDWTTSPVLHFDFNAEDFSREDGLEHMLDSHLRNFETTYGRNLEDPTLSTRFRTLIRSAHELTGRQVVILVDEYDKPLLAVEDNKLLFERNQTLLKSFFGNLKTMDPHIRFAFITGVARFSKVSIFSDLNNLDDISLSDDFADICGWTEKELIDSFTPGIEALTHKREEDQTTTMTALRDYYDGYRFTPGGSRLYNPFSVMLALKNKRIAPYWFASGTPTFLVRRIHKSGIYPPDINGVRCSEDDLMAVGFNDRNPVPMMFQTGYLTIGSYNDELEVYNLRFPNREVEIGFYKDLLRLYVPATDEVGSPFSFTDFKLDLSEGRPDDFMRRLETLLKDLPGEDHCESTYRAVTYLIAVLCGSQTVAEHHGYKGRSDIEAQTKYFIYLFEFKYNRSVSEAMDQIRSRDYAGRFCMNPRTVYLIGANFVEKKEERCLQYEIEKL